MAIDAVFAGAAVKRALFNWTPSSVRADEKVRIQSSGELSGVTALSFRQVHCKEGIVIQNSVDLVTLTFPNLTDLGV